ncbi:hypothetical protein [Spirosoma endophyticum]|nr:hypothetical protein [Spirosoma endophyticum]
MATLNEQKSPFQNKPLFLNLMNVLEIVWSTRISNNLLPVSINTHR